MGLSGLILFSMQAGVPRTVYVVQVAFLQNPDVLALPLN